uniref:J domain-containing protein n=1 Tax=Oryza barthii TaxID=65489 RepID=A0A0D3EY48_9ORYZ
MGGDAEAAAGREAIAAKMRGEDYAGARTLLLETLQTNPRLDDAFEMLSVLEVLCAAAETRARRPGLGRGRGVDWYRILQVLPRDDAAKIDAQYRSIVRQVEPVRDDLPGAEAALRLVNDAYAVLSDPAKKVRYDSTVANVELWCEDILQTKGICTADRSTHDYPNAELGRLSTLEADCNAVAGISNNVPSYAQQTDRSCLDVGDCSNVASSSKTKRTDSCFLDDDGFQLPDENHVDKKQKSVCEKDVHCVSSPHVDLDDRFTDPLDNREDELCSITQYDVHNFENDREIVNFAAGQIWAAYDWEKFPRRYARINKIVADKEHLYVSWFKPSPQSHDENRWFSASLPFVCGIFIADECKISVTCPTMLCHQISSDNWNHHLKVYPQEGEVWAIYSDWDIGWCNDPGMRKKSTFYVVEILNSYLKGSGCTVAQLVKVDGYRSVFQRHVRSGREQLLQVHIHNLLMFSHRIPSFRFTCDVGTVFELEHSAVPENLQYENTSASVAPLYPLQGLHDDSNGFHEAAATHLSNPSTSKMDLGNPQQGMMNYNNKLSPEHFVEGQIWAVYDAPDRMPRSYVRVIRVVSHTAVSVLKLEPHPMLNEEIHWVEDGLPVACGVFRAGSETACKEISEFSHPVECDWSAKRSFYRIFPKKGEIWAMYKNWKIAFSNADIDKCEPRMVEILSDYSDEIGVNVCRLTRVKGCLTFFQRVIVEDFHLTKLISRSEMLSFSHRVPAYVVIEIKDRDIPKGSWHLEPNALPLRNID